MLISEVSVCDANARGTDDLMSVCVRMSRGGCHRDYVTGVSICE